MSEQIYPIKPGEVWRVGPHLVMCGDITAIDVDRFLALVKPDPMVTYCDPPWREVVQKSYLADAGQPVPETVDMNDLHDRIILAASRSMYVYFEMGLDQAEQFKRRIRHMFGDVMEECELTYRGGLQRCKLIQASWLDCLKVLPVPPVNYDHEVAPQLVIKQVTQPGDVVFDPVCGVGCTAIAALRNKCIFMGVEFSSNRVYMTLRNLEVMSGFQPERIDYATR